MEGKQKSAFQIQAVTGNLIRIVSLVGKRITHWPISSLKICEVKKEKIPGAAKACIRCLVILAPQHR